MKPIVKKVKKALKITTVTLVLATTLIMGASVYQNVKLADYSSDEQINTITEQLDCDASYISKQGDHIVRMEHNGDEPIYVYFDETVSEQDKSIAIESLDYVFGIIGEINENYRYQVVDESEYNSKFNKVTIKYSTGDPEARYQGKGVDVDGSALSIPNLLSILTNKRTMNHFRIVVRDRENENVSRENRLYTYIHELLHLVAFDDVHTLKSIQTTTKYYGNTIMQSAHGGKMACVLTPNDYKAILAIYTTKLNQEELADRIEEYKEKVANYEREYYEFFTEKVIERNNVTEHLEQEDIDCVAGVSMTMLDGTTHYFNYDLKIRNDKYQFKIFDENYNVLEKTEGEVFWKNGVAVLKNVELKKGMRPGVEIESYEGGFVEDLSLVVKDNHIELYNVFSNESYWLKQVEIENDLNI